MSDVRAEWTAEQAAELLLEQFVMLLDGCADEDTVRPAMIFEALRQVWAPATEAAWNDELTAGQVRALTAAARRRLADGELIP